MLQPDFAFIYSVIPSGFWMCNPISYPWSTISTTALCF